MSIDEKQIAFQRVMGDPSMPDDAAPDYDEWLFNKAWEAAKAQATGQPEVEEEIDGYHNRNAPRTYIQPKGTGKIFYEDKNTQQPVGKTLIADEDENVWRDDNGDIWEPIRARFLEREIFTLTLDEENTLIEEMVKAAQIRGYDGKGMAAALFAIRERYDLRKRGPVNEPELVPANTIRTCQCNDCIEIRKANGIEGGK